MKRIIPLAGVQLPASVSLPAISRTPEGRAMGGIPGWNMFADPDFRTASTVRNRAKPNSHIPAQNGSMAMGVMGGKTAWQLATSTPRFVANTDMNPNAWSMFFTVQTPLAGSTGGRELLRSLSTDSSTGIAPRLVIRTAGQLSVLTNDSADVRADAVGPIPDNVPFLVMATFSTRDGVRIFRDGQQLVHNPNDRRPLNSDYHAGQYVTLRGNSNFVMAAGMHGILDIDLGWPEHAGYRRAIEGFVMGYYGIG